MDTLSDGRGGRDGPTIDVVSPSNLERLRAAGSPKIARGHYQLFDKQLTREDLKKDWHPSHFRDFVAHNPEDVAQHLDKAS